MLLINPVTALLQSPLCVVYQVSPLQREQGHTRSIRCDRKNVRTSGVFLIVFLSIIFSYVLSNWIHIPSIIIEFAVLFAVAFIWVCRDKG
jgi:hypothetical protein